MPITVTGGRYSGNATAIASVGSRLLLSVFNLPSVIGRLNK